ncbi:hypothetical protein [Clostridium sp.]|uniref:hypothetical protein n=1 Tax=Clostridium sp. TaxID=1506 RepID=UPI001A41A565|nr:hypothetical protein [Clostridium sp.]MBK5239777.1 hypothetical protein [Clostridium sp.]
MENKKDTNTEDIKILEEIYNMISDMEEKYSTLSEDTKLFLQNNCEHGTFYYLSKFEDGNIDAQYYINNKMN